MHLLLKMKDNKRASQMTSSYFVMRCIWNTGGLPDFFVGKHGFEVFSEIIFIKFNQTISYLHNICSMHQYRVQSGALVLKFHKIMKNSP